MKNINFASRPYMYFSEQGNVDDDATVITIFLVSFNLQSYCLMQSAVYSLQSAVCTLQMSYTVELSPQLHSTLDTSSPSLQSMIFAITLSAYKKSQRTIFLEVCCWSEHLHKNYANKWTYILRHIEIVVHIVKCIAIALISYCHMWRPSKNYYE